MIHDNVLSTIGHTPLVRLSRVVSGLRCTVLAKLEEGRSRTGGIAAGLDDLPLFAAVPAEEAAPDPVHAALAGIEPDRLAPREALELIYELKRLQAESGT